MRFHIIVTTAPKISIAAIPTTTTTMSPVATAAAGRYGRGIAIPGAAANMNAALIGFSFGIDDVTNGCGGGI
jgi:hypothetical protein